MNETNGKRVVLSGPERYAFQKWLAAEWPTIKRERPSQADTVAKYNRLALRRAEETATGFAGHWRLVSLGHLRGAVAALGKRWPESHKAEQERRKAGMRHQIAVIAFEIQRLYGALAEIAGAEFLPIDTAPSKRFAETFPMTKTVHEVNGGAIGPPDAAPPGNFAVEIRHNEGARVIDFGEGADDAAVSASSLGQAARPAEMNLAVSGPRSTISD